MIGLSENLRCWFQDYWKVVLLVGMLTALGVALGLWRTRYSAMPVIHEEASIVRFGAYSFEDGPQPVVLVRMDDGRVVQLLAPRRATSDCRVGGRIQLQRQGNVLRVRPGACTSSAS